MPSRNHQYVSSRALRAQFILPDRAAKENRPVGDYNKVGILHAKCAAADGEWLFLSSANLTQQAFTINLELWMLIRGGTIPRRVEQQFELLMQRGQLKQV
ncbi:MAG: hypothetical protein HY649_06015 [Acidobacteria bacterium]|nr:hypothetical protein [Acidobacteriota bacterium]